jgi:predicted amidophosphoribosyltransferase
MTILREREVRVSEIVKCGICGKSFNKRHVKSHTRLAHKKKSNPDFSAKDEEEVMEEIVHLYERLSDKERKELQIRLKSLA